MRTRSRHHIISARTTINMAKWTIVALALIGCAVAEPPIGYSYAPAISSGGHYSSGGLSSGGHYSSVPIGHQTSEGYHVDPHLLEKIKHIILKDEIQNESYQSASLGSHGLSSHYGAPAPVYGVPHSRTVGIELGHIQQGLQVAQYHQADEDYSSGYAGGYSSGGHGGYSSGASLSYSAPSVSYSGPSISYSAPSSGHGYATIGAPSGSYGVPSISSSYGAPHH